MEIYTRKPQQGNIPIVPMLDILTILLIFFIVHTEFKQQVSVLKLDLPQTRHLAGEVGDRHSVLLEVGADGTLALDGQQLGEHELGRALHQLRRERPDARVQLSAAEGASMGQFIRVMDSLHAAGLPLEEIPVRIDYRP